MELFEWHLCRLSAPWNPAPYRGLRGKLSTAGKTKGGAENAEVGPPCGRRWVSRLALFRGMSVRGFSPSRE